MIMLVSMTLMLMKGHSGSADGKKSSVELSGQLSKLATTVGHFLRNLDFENAYMA